MTSHHHVAIRTADIERAAAFYIQAFDAQWQAAPWEMNTPGNTALGSRFTMCFLRLGDSPIELFQFHEPASPTEGRPQSELGVMHFALQVTDIAASAARVVEAGGSVLSEPFEWGDAAQLCYVRDPDGNVIELLNVSVEEVVRLTVAQFPEADPHERARDAELIVDT